MENKEFKNFIKEFKKEILKHEHIIIFRHVNPDGDCLGAQQGLKLWLKKMFPNKSVYAIGNNENLFSFLNWKYDDIPNEEVLKESLAIIVDANYSNRLINNELIIQNKIKTLIRIDHHPEKDDIDYKLRFVNENFSSSCEQIALIIKTIKPQSLDKEIAKFLYLGIYTDTGRFFYDYTSPRTHNLVSWLMETKFNFVELHKNLAKRDLIELEFNKEVLNNYKTQKNVIYYYISNQRANELNIPESLRNRVDFLANIEGYNIWIFFIENKDKKIRVRLRSNEKNVGMLARKYGGGGHDKAAGAIIDSKNLIKEIVEEATKL